MKQYVKFLVLISSTLWSTILFAQTLGAAYAPPLASVRADLASSSSALREAAGTDLQTHVLTYLASEPGDLGEALVEGLGNGDPGVRLRAASASQIALFGGQAFGQAFGQADDSGPEVEQVGDRLAREEALFADRVSDLDFLVRRESVRLVSMVFLERPVPQELLAPLNLAIHAGDVRTGVLALEALTLPGAPDPMSTLRTVYQRSGARRMTALRLMADWARISDPAAVDAEGLPESWGVVALDAADTGSRGVGLRYLESCRCASAATRAIIASMAAQHPSTETRYLSNLVLANIPE